jgi:hypothetical protein
MADKKAQDIIALEERERGKQANFRSLWQDTADLNYPRENQIVDKNTPGLEKMNRVFDTTAITESQNMASGLSQNLVPPGQRFFALKASDREVREIDTVKSYMSKATEIAHDHLFGSNFMLQLVETLRSLVVFGTGNLYSEFNTEIVGLNFKDYAIGTYQILENSQGRVDTMILKFQLTARQAAQEFENPGKAVTEALSDADSNEKEFWFIHVVRPRKQRNANFTDNLNMPFESVFVSIKDQEVVDEGGFDEFPYQAARWLKSSTEKYGRGIGTELLPHTRGLNQIKADFNEVGNKWSKPPKEVLESFEGEVNCNPDALNFVPEMNTIKAIQGDARGSFPITKDILEMERQTTKDAYFASAFAPISGLSGDRRGTLEIRQRVLESFKKIGSPIGRIESELFTPTIERVVSLLIRNGKIPPPPPELSGKGFKVEYVGALSLALQSGEVEASQQWISILGEIELIEPGTKDNVDFDSAVRRMARTFGVNEEDIASQEEVAEKREARAQAQQQQQLMEAAQVAGQANQGLAKAPEEGSPGQVLMEAGA